MEKTIDFGKIDYHNINKRNCRATVTIRWDNVNFAASGNVWNHKETDIISGGQNLDTLNKYLKNNILFETIYNLWKNYHLNDMTPGSPKQMKHLATIERPQDAEFYKWECDQLEKVNLLIDESFLHDGKPYKYGTAWLLKEIPENVKRKINMIVKSPITKGVLHEF